MGALVSFHEDKFPSVEGLMAYIGKLEGTAKPAPGHEAVISRAWATPRARLSAAVSYREGRRRRRAMRLALGDEYAKLLL